MEVRVRMAPSPTGNLHLGTAYTTFFNYLFAKVNKGKFILRIEDTDQSRSKKEFEDNILNGLKWLGLLWDEQPERQSERLERYKEAADKLIAEGKAYYCFCSVGELELERKVAELEKRPYIYSGKCRKLSENIVQANLQQGRVGAIRFAMPEQRKLIEFDDLIHGKVGFESNLLGDMIIQRSNGMPLYNFAVVVDDIDMKISHILRGDDHLSNTPKQIVLFEALNAEVPVFAHWPAILNPDRIGKLSKRENATAVSDYAAEGYLPEALLNYFAILGWTMPGEEELMSLSEMEQVFDIKKMRLSGAAFDHNKLDWVNGEYIRKMTDEQLTERLEQFLVDHPAKDKIAVLVPLVKDRIKKLSDFIPLTNFIFVQPEYDVEVFAKLKIPHLKDVLQAVCETLEQLPEPWDAKQFEQQFRQLADQLDLPAGTIFQLIRVAISGQPVTPPLFETMEIIGEDEILQRVKNLILQPGNIGA